MIRNRLQSPQFGLADQPAFRCNLGFKRQLRGVAALLAGDFNNYFAVF
jgi:hypothetical protein